MPIITLPDGTQKQYEHPITLAQVAASIGAGLAKAAIAGKVNEQLVDTAYCIENDASVRILTSRDPEGLEIIRHSTAHLLAHAVKQLFPEAQVTIGPVIQDGFYYDFSYPPNFQLDDLARIEERMNELAKQDYTVSRQVINRAEAIEFFRKKGEEYKAKIIEEIPPNEPLTLYKQGDFVDLCKGPHVPHTGMLNAFKLTKLAGAYWRGNANNEMLQRIYGTAWPDKKALEEYLRNIEEAEKRDHRKIAKKMGLFHIQEEAPGMVFWHTNGWAIFQTIEQYLRKKLQHFGYEEVRTPQIIDRSFWEKSGHWEKYHEEMFITESEKHTYAIKPMSCPGHVQIFNQGLKSYRDLPIRFAEFGCCHRNEPSGSLHGLMRVRNFTQDDGHIFCTEDQIGNEMSDFIKQLQEIYADFGFKDIQVKLSTRPPNRLGSEKLWDKAEKILADGLDASGLKWESAPGDGAFYGPKIEFAFRDCLNRLWTCGTFQLDFYLPERFGAHYIAEDNTKRIPVMLHRAIVGSIERFIGMLIEQYAGALPLWLAPVQVSVMSITDHQHDYVQKIVATLKNLEVRAIPDLRNEKIGFKIREHTIQRIPYLLVIGDREVESNSVAVRTQSGHDLGVMPLAVFIERIKNEMARHSRITEE